MTTKIVSPEEATPEEWAQIESMSLRILAILDEAQDSDIKTEVLGLIGAEAAFRMCRAAEDDRSFDAHDVAGDIAARISRRLTEALMRTDQDDLPADFAGVDITGRPN